MPLNISDFYWWRRSDGSLLTLSIIQIVFAVAMIVLSRMWISYCDEIINDSYTSEETRKFTYFLISILIVIIIVYVVEILTTIVLMIGLVKDKPSYLLVWLISTPITATVITVIAFTTKITVLEGIIPFSTLYMVYFYYMVYVIYDIIRTTSSDTGAGVTIEEQTPILTSEQETISTENEHQTAPLMVSGKFNYGSLSSSA